MQKLIISFFLLIIATVFETNGDAFVRKAMFNHSDLPFTRCLFLIGSAAMLLVYALLLNTTPISFGKVVGLYISTLFVVWQVTAYLQFRSIPSLSVLIGGAMIVIGGLIVSFFDAGETGHG